MAVGIVAASNSDAARSIHQYKHHVARFERLVDLLQHAAVELRAGLVHAGCVDKDDLRGGICILVRGTSTTPIMRLRVVCGLAVTMATFSPVRALRSVLLPTLGRPRMATNPDFKGWWYSCLLLSRIAGSDVQPDVDSVIDIISA